MSVVGCDSSFSHQSGAALAGAGIRSIGRYAGPADPRKTITAAELADHNAHGVTVWLVYEVDVSSWRGGYNTGKLHGEQTRGWARSTLGWPNSRPIFAAYDTNVTVSDHDLFVAYQRGFNDGQGVPAPGAAYGDGYLLRVLRDLGLIAYTWLSDSSAFSESRDFAARGNPSIIQYYGRTVPGLSGIDVDECFGDDWGQHPAPTQAPPVSVSPTSESVMYLVQEKGSATVYQIGAGPNGVTAIGDQAKLHATQAILIGVTGRKEAGNVWPVDPGYVDNIRKG